MSIVLSEVAVTGGPLPEGDLCAYGYDPVTSAVYLTRLLDETYTEDITVLHVQSSPSIIKYTGELYPGIVKLEYMSYVSHDSSLTHIPSLDTLRVGTMTVLEDGGNPNSVALRVNNTDIMPSRYTNGIEIQDHGIYTIVITTYNSSEFYVVSLELPIDNSSYMTYNNQFNQLPALIFASGDYSNNPTIISLTSESFNSVAISEYNPINTTWGYVRKNNKHLAVQTIAPFPPNFYDAEWYDLVNYTEIGEYTINYIKYVMSRYLLSVTYTSTPDLSKVVKLLTDIHLSAKPDARNIALITQESPTQQLLWYCKKEQRVHKVLTVDYPVWINLWIPSENVYKYKASKIYFGGKNYSGPLNTIMYDAGDGVTFTEHAILDLNEFPINANNEVFVYDYVSNYSSSSPKVYCVLNKISGRMAEIDVVSKTVKYFTLVVPIDYEIQKLYYTNRLMYTVKASDNTALSLYDANNNGTLMYTFDLGTYDPSVLPQFSIIN